MKINSKLCILFGLLITFFLLITVLYGVYKFQSNSHLNNEKLLRTNAVLKQQTLDQRILNTFSTLKIAAQEIELTDDGKLLNDADALQTLTNIYNQIPCNDVYLGLIDGGCFDYLTKGIYPDFNARESKREWFLGIVDDKKDFLLTKPFTNANNVYIMAYSIPLLKNSKILGTLTMEVKVNTITKFIESISDNNNFFVTNHDGFIFASKNADEIGKNIFEILPLFKQYRDEKNAEFSFNWETNGNQEFKVFTSTLDTLDWTFWQYESYANIEKDGKSYLFHSLIFLAIFLCISLIITYIIAGYIAKPLSSATNILSTLSDTGDTDHKPNEKLLKRKDEIGDMERALNQLIAILNKKSSVAQKIADGDLNVNVTVLSEKDKLGNAFAKMANDLNFTLKEINTSVNQVSSGANQISSSSQSLSQGATEQAASLEEITSSMIELGGQTTANAENATAANQLATETAKAAATGQERMNKLSEAMTQISKNAEETQKVIKTIDDIAFQTNLLALNAAVEAARAGIHGKGFAVVAEEVRNLAARSAKAAAETADLIQNSNNQINEGVTISQQTAAALNEISVNVTKTTDTIAEIALASSEQAEGIKQINIGLKQIDSVTQQNTANAEETASASEEMSSTATLLKELVKHFKLKEISQADSKSHKKTLSDNSKKSINTIIPQKNTDWDYTPNNTNATVVKPSDHIRLDDNEFGKF